MPQIRRNNLIILAFLLREQGWGGIIYTSPEEQ